MSTKIIGATTKLFNNFTETGRLKNKMYKDLSEIGMREIRQRAVSKDKFVLMASKEKGCGKSNIRQTRHRQARRECQTKIQPHGARVHRESKYQRRSKTKLP